MKNPEMLEALSALAIEKGISEEIMLEALANALVTAYKRMPDAAEEALVEIDVETGEIRVIAQELNEEGDVTREWDDTPGDFGRIAAQTAKQVILQRIREAEFEGLLNGRFRHNARFRCWRTDKDPGDCTYAQLESVPPAELREMFA